VGRQVGHLGQLRRGRQIRTGSGSDAEAAAAESSVAAAAQVIMSSLVAEAGLMLTDPMTGALLSTVAPALPVAVPPSPSSAVTVQVTVPPGSSPAVSVVVAPVAPVDHA
jgi:hypothetical protein